MFDNPICPEIGEWFSRFDIAEVSCSVCSIDLITEPPEHWFFKRNKLRSDSLKLNLCVPSIGNWRVDLSRHDNLFHVQWRPNDDLRIDSQQLRYRKLVRWPRIQRLMDFPLLLGQLEQCLGIQFHRHVDFGARLLRPNELARNAKIQQWLAPCADTFGWDGRMWSE